MLSKTYLKAISIILSASSGLILYNHGLFSSIQPKEQTIQSKTYIYTNKTGRYENQQTEWERINTEMNTTFKNSYAVGIYYDNPQQLQDKNQCRLSMGFFVNDNEKQYIQQFIEKYPQYQLVQLPQVKSIQISFPYKSFLTYIIASFKVYPKIQDYCLNQKLQSNCIVESYLFENNSNNGQKQIVFDAVFGQGSDKYLLM